MRYAHSNCVQYRGYEIPKNVHRLTKKVLNKLSQSGVVVVNYDDSFGRIAAEELEQIAGSIGLIFTHVRNHQFILVDENGCDKFGVDLESSEKDFDC
jgi:hypothetical protein